MFLLISIGEDFAVKKEIGNLYLFGIAQRKQIAKWQKSNCFVASLFAMSKSEIKNIHHLTTSLLHHIMRISLHLSFKINNHAGITNDP
jgi:hypothetical protein